MDPYLGEIRTTAFNFAPRGWAMCNGQLLPIAQNAALFSLLGTMYGGNGSTNFALPDLRGRSPMHVAPGQWPGSAVGAETHTLSAAELPSHRHRVHASNLVSDTSLPAGAVPAAVSSNGPTLYTTPDQMVRLQPESIGVSGGSQAHTNMPPYLTLNFIIALVGIYPSRP